MIYVYIGGIEHIYSYLNCLLLSNTLCSYDYIIVTQTRKLFSTVFGILKLNQCLVIKTNEYSNVRSLHFECSFHP